MQIGWKFEGHVWARDLKPGEVCEVNYGDTGNRAVFMATDGGQFVNLETGAYRPLHATVRKLKAKLEVEYE